MLKKISVILLFGIIVSRSGQLVAQTPLCGGSGGSAFILPSTPNVNALMIYVSFPSGGQAGTDNTPSFASTAAQHHANYYDEMSYNTHHVNVQPIQRPSPNQGKAFIANNPLGYYYGTVTTAKSTELNTEILNQAYAENPSVFNGISVVFMFIGGGIFSNASAWAQLPETSSNYSGCGAMIEWGYWGTDEEKIHKWHMAHEYGHLLSSDGTSGRRLFDQYTDQPSGIYNIMHYQHFNVTQPMPAFILIYLGWIRSSWIKEIDPTQSGDQSQTVTIKDTRLAPSAGNYNVVRIKIPGGAPNEHFIVESRQGTGFDAYLSSGGKGLIIWHLNKSYGTYNTLGSMDVEIATAIGAHGQDWLDDGVGYGEARVFITDFFSVTNKANFAPWTNPSTETGYKYSNATHLFTDLGILNINSPGASMTFSFAENPPPGPPQNLQITNVGQNGQHPILQWSANTEPDFASYKVYRGYQNSKTSPINWLTNPVATVTTTTWTDPLVTIDTSAPSSVHYRLKAVDAANNYSNYSNSVSTKSYTVPKNSPEPIEETTTSLPKEIALHQNYPNPFNPRTDIRFDIPEAAHVTLKIYNLLGEEIRTLVDNDVETGFHAISWDGKNETGKELPSGVYIYRFHAKSGTSKIFVAAKKLTLLR
jgi:hypothetical protein